MIDARLRPVKDRAARPLAAALARRCGPFPLTVAALAAGLAAAGAAAAGLVVVSVVLWLANRLLDGLDGAVARERGASSDLGGYVDIVADTVVYAAVPLGIAVAVDDRAAWIAVAALIATFYVNAVSWAYLAALLEKRRAGAATTGEITSVRMPAGLVEGAETVVLMTIMLAFPSQAVTWFAVTAALVAMTVVHRATVAVRLLRVPAA